MKKLNCYIIWLLIFLAFCFIFIMALDRIFVLVTAPRVISLSPESGSQNVSLNSSLIINFDKPIKRKEIQPSISPEAHGEWRFENPLIENHLFRTLVFVPAVDFEPGVQYQVKLENITGFGFKKSSSFQFSFKTIEASLLEIEDKKIPKNGIETPSETKPEESKPKVTMLEISLDWQDYNLSCEAASLKMALAGKGIFVSEDEIMGKIGYDLTPRKGDTWGNPYEKYVGEIDGKICETGYGVYWEPVAKAAQNWREAETFSEWKLKDLIQEIEAGNPIIVWGILPTGTLTDCSWHTPEGKYIIAFKETHVRVVIGFIGFPDNPSKIILNDPYTGRLYWETAYFLENWKVFNYSGVVVR